MTLKNINNTHKNIILASCLPAEALIKVCAFLTACAYLAWVFLTNYPARRIENIKLNDAVKKIGRYSFKWSLEDEDNWPIIKRCVKSYLF
jgi:hypothetical protein